MCKNVPPIIEKIEKRRQIKVARTKRSRELSGRSKKFKTECTTDRYYGPQSQKPDLPSDVYQQLEQNHLAKLLDNAENREQIELETRGQSKCELWQLLRREMLTASDFGTVCRMRPTTSCAATVKNILYPSFVGNAATKYGRDMEEIAKEDLAVKLKKEIKPCGLFIDCDNPCLGASPDGLIDDDGLVEIKCPLSAENLSADEAIKSLPQLRGIFDKKNSDKMNRNHRYFYQVQGQLNITQRHYCMFAMWTPKSLKTVHVKRDDVFWKEKMLPFLIRFYNECILPEILDSRHNRHMPIRNPKYIVEAKEAKKINVNKDGCPRKNKQTKRPNDNLEELIPKNKHLTCNDFAMKAPSAAALNTEKDDCIIINHFTQELTEDEVARRKKILDDTILSVSLVKQNVLPINSKVNDEALDLFLRIVKETSCFETQSVQYINFPDLITASDYDKSLQIIGGNCTDHWRCIYFDGSKLHVYDSLSGCTYDKLVAKEKNYIQLRYPKISRSDIIFENVQTQSDGTCCGIFAAAFATTVALGGNPCNETYSKDVRCMRQHFMEIIENNKLLPFPR